MEDLVRSIKCRSKFLRPIAVSFDVILKDDVIHVEIPNLPTKGQPWYIHCQSSNRESYLPIENVPGKEKASLAAVAKALCKEIGVGVPKEFKNVCRNYVDLWLPGFIKFRFN